MLQYRKDYRQYENGFTNVGGVSYCGTKIKNCYNTGTVSLTGKGYAGGVVGEFRDGSCNYNVGKVTAKGKYAMAGEIAGYVSGENTVSDNYYTGSGKKSGREYTSWVPYQSKAKKVSSITSANCRNCHQSTGYIPASIRDLS